LNAAEEEEVLRLDSFIEKALDKKSLVPEIMKKNTESESLLNLLKAVDDLKKKLTSNE
jgi:hypothetical protein